jgi:hypothetical protein
VFLPFLEISARALAHFLGTPFYVKDIIRYLKGKANIPAVNGDSRSAVAGCILQVWPLK